MSRRDEEKKRRRQKRQSKRRDRSEGPDAEETLRRAERAMRSMEEGMRVGLPATWPGGCDPSLGRPDMIKYELATRATETQPGKSKFHDLEERLKKGPLGDLPELDHWALEEFFWHGVPGDSWNPVEAFLEHSGARFPPAAQEQLRRFKQARVGLYQVGEVANDTVEFREWDLVRRSCVGAPFRAITLSIGGVNGLRTLRGKYNLTHVAPWRPDEGLFCGMGYGVFLDLHQTPIAADFLGFRQLAAAATPLPWQESRSARAEYLGRWRQPRRVALLAVGGGFASPPSTRDHQRSSKQRNRGPRGARHHPFHARRDSNDRHLLPGAESQRKGAPPRRRNQHPAPGSHLGQPDGSGGIPGLPANRGPAARSAWAAGPHELADLTAGQSPLRIAENCPRSRAFSPGERHDQKALTQWEICTAFRGILPRPPHSAPATRNLALPAVR